MVWLGDYCENYGKKKNIYWGNDDHKKDLDFINLYRKLMEPMVFQERGHF